MPKRRMCSSEFKREAVALANQPAGEPDPEYPFDQAWCDECNEVFLKKGGEWNDVSEGFADVMVICAGCFSDLRESR